MAMLNTRGTTRSINERQEAICQFVSAYRRATIDEIALEFNVSKATARRDVAQLTRVGQLARFHGGALAIKDNFREQPLLSRSKEQADEKRAIGALAASLVKDGDTIFLGSGTTTLEVARHLRSRPNLSIITNSLMVINTLYNSPNITIICPGGILRNNELSMIGHICERSLEELRADKVIMGIHSLDLDNGLSSDHLPEILTDRSILKLAPKVILVADHTKLGKVSSIILGPITSVHTLVTDRQTPEDFVQELRHRGIYVLIA